MAFTTTSNFAGKAAGFYISAALKASNSLDYLTMIENIKYKSNIQAMNNTVSAVADATCDFTSAGTLALTEKVLEPKNLQINLDLCKSTLLDSWEALQMRAGAGAPPPASFDDYVISYMGDIIAEATEDSIWNGTAVAGKFNGFNGAATGLLLPLVDGTVVQDAATGAYVPGNIIANLQGAVQAIPAAVLGKEDLHIYMNQTTYQAYISAVSTLGYVNAYNMNGDYVPMFEGYKIAVCNGMTTNEIVIAQKSNMFFGTDLISDATRITLMDMAALDGSDNMRLVARYSAGVQTGTGADIVRQS
jgi:surface antigen|tara:strand:- start:13 stop:921 length:909 start_codon:yes stop_codon:yes gene_type:complete